VLRDDDRRERAQAHAEYASKTEPLKRFYRERGHS